MGYRSDILIAVAFKTKTQRDEIWAVYCMDPNVQKHNLAAQWQHTDDGGFTPIAYYYAEHVKWYDNYEDVQGIERLLALVEEFNEQRQLPFAWIKYRIGEELTDVEVESHQADDDNSDLSGALWQRASIERRITHSFQHTRRHTMTYFRSFNHVANEYNDTAPVNEREYARDDADKKPYGKSRNIRPIDNRSRKWERIAKLSDDCYALLCGHTYGDTVYPAWRFKGVGDLSPSVVASYAPIAWHRIGEDDVISVSNSWYSQPIAHHQFLRTWLPRGMTLVNRNGKHFLKVQQPEGEAKYSLRLADPDEKQVKHNSFNLKFKVAGDGVFLPYKLPEAATKQLRKRVDKDLKQRFKVRLEEFNQWVMAMGPLFPKDWKSKDEIRREAHEYVRKVPSYYNHNVWRIDSIPAELAREALILHDHPLRMYLGMEAWSAATGSPWPKDERTLDRLRAFNNKVFGFEKEVDVDM